jgi:tRNA threonylcarbamoyladenosine biosynthesis protein TsaE
VLQPVLQPAVEAPILGSRELRWPDEAACAAFARQLARHPLLAQACIELHGPLGAGKTTFVRHLLHALGVEGRIKSPTYTVMEPYALPGLAVSHFDFYRFSDPREWADAGFRDVFAAPGLKLSEWPEQAAGMLPVADLRLFIDVDAGDLQHTADARHVRLEAGTALGLELLA